MTVENTATATITIPATGITEDIFIFIQHSNFPINLAAAVGVTIHGATGTTTPYSRLILLRNNYYGEPTWYAYVDGHIQDISGKQDNLVSGTSIKTVNSTTLLGSGDITVQQPLVSGTSIKTVNSTTLLGSGDITVQASLVSGTSIKTVNSTTLLGSGDITVQPTLVSGTNIKTVNSTTLLGTGDITVQAPLVSGTNIKTVNGTTILGTGDITVGGGGVTISNDSVTNASYYPIWSTITTGSLSTGGISSANLSFNPSTGTLYSTNFNTTSDVNLKENIYTVTNSLNIIKSLNPVEFTWKSSGLKSSGIIAQELEMVLPFLVSDNEFRSVNYNGIIAYLIGAIKELSDRLEANGL